MFLQKFVPDIYVDSIYDIDIDSLKKRGIRGIITDLDNTLIEWDRPDATQELIEWIEGVKQAGLQVVIVSNNRSHQRVAHFSNRLGIPYLNRAKKPVRTPFLQAMSQMDAGPHQVAVVGDQLLTDIFGGNRIGAYTILVVPVAQSDGFFTRINRVVERRVLASLKKRGLWNREDSRHES